MKIRRIVAAAISAALVISLAAPASALAVQPVGKGKNNAPKGAPKSNGVNAQAKADHRAEVLQNRITRMLAQRKRKFDAAEARLQRRITRLTVLASKVASGGADVTTATVALNLASEKLVKAAEEEQKAADLFKAVPTAADRKAAFAAARAQAKVAQKSLQAARLQVVRAMQALRRTIVSLEAQES